MQQPTHCCIKLDLFINILVKILKQITRFHFRCTSSVSLAVFKLTEKQEASVPELLLYTLSSLTCCMSVYSHLKDQMLSCFEYSSPRGAAAIPLSLSSDERASIIS